MSGFHLGHLLELMTNFTTFLAPGAGLENVAPAPIGAVDRIFASGWSDVLAPPVGCFRRSAQVASSDSSPRERIYGETIEQVRRLVIEGL